MLWIKNLTKDRPRFGLSLLLVAVSVLNFTDSRAATFSAGIERSQWYFSSSIFECALTHDIPHFGRGIFYHEAGEDLLFLLDSARSTMREGKAALVIEAPKWRPGQAIRDLGLVAVGTRPRVVSVNNPRASQMMDGLLAGMMPTFTRRSTFNEDTVRVEVSSVKFAQYYEDYLNCVASLLPVNFRQVERTRVFFKVDESVLSDDDKTALDKVVLFTKADPTVTAVFVDGHTDVTGRRIYNRRLSKDRANAVNDYLVNQGIAAEMIILRYHGERYPVVKKPSKDGHARNRRTTVRLERGTQPVPDEEISLEMVEKDF